MEGTTDPFMPKAGRTIAIEEAPDLAAISPRYAQGRRDKVLTINISIKAPPIPCQPAIRAP